MWTFLAVAAAVAVTLAVVYRQRIMAWLGGAGGPGGREAAPADPLARYQEKVDEAGGTLKHVKAGLDRCRTLIDSLQRQIADGQRDCARLDVRIKAALGEGHEEQAAEYVQQLQAARAGVEENKKQLAVNQEMYASFLKQVQAAQERITQAKREGESLGAQLQTSQAEADLTEITEQLSDDPSLDALDADREAILWKIDANRAKALTARDLHADRLEEAAAAERVRQVEVKTLLDQYKAEMKKGP